MDVFKLSRTWFDFCFENPEKISPTHTAMYFFIIEHCNRLGWKEKFGLPMEMTKDAIGIKNYRTYSKTFNDLIEWGFVKIIEKSKNQYSSNIIAIAENTKATTKALDKAIQKHCQKQEQKQYKSIVGIDIQETRNNKQETISFDCLDSFKPILIEWFNYKKSRKESYKDEDSKNKLYKKLLKLSNNSSIKAQQIVDESMSNNWAGIFELKEKNAHGSQSNKPSNTTSAPTRVEY